MLTLTSSVFLVYLLPLILIIDQLFYRVKTNSFVRSTNWKIYYSDITRVLWHLKHQSLGSLFSSLFRLTKSKHQISALLALGDQWIPSQMAQDVESFSISCHHDSSPCLTVLLSLWSAGVCWFDNVLYILRIDSSPPPPPPEKMAAILQTIFSYAFSWMKCFVFWLKFPWDLFLRIQFTITQLWFK